METKKSILLRIDPKLWDDLNEWSKDDLRSLNAQIEWVLRESVRKRKGKSVADKTKPNNADENP